MLFSKTKSQLGLDIGSSNIKIVQLRPDNDRFVLETYGIVNVSYQIANKESSAVIKPVAEVLTELMRRAGVTTNKVVASLPNNSVFTSVIELPKIPDDELKKAVEFEAKKYVPLPLSEVALSWSVIDEKKTKKDIGLGANLPEKIKVLLTAVPSVVINNYIQLFKLCGLEASAIEIEALALIRSLVGEDSVNCILIDIGAKSTSVNLVENGYLRLSKNLNIGGDSITLTLAKSLSVNYNRAEQFNKDFGLSGNTQLPQVMRPILDIIRNEAGQLINLFESRGRTIDKVIISGGGSRLPNLKEYLSTLGKPLVSANPWSHVVAPDKLKAVIEPLGLNLAVAMGLAMRHS